MKTPLITSLAVAAALAAPAAASADSIVYVAGGNVWSISPDGKRDVRLTDGGNWHSPTQADDGTIAAVQGTGPIQVMAPDGRPIRSIQTRPERTGNGGTFAPRPLKLSFSPDGTKIAYSYEQFSCPPASTCSDQQSTFYTRADVTEATPTEVWGNQYSTSNPEWITNDRTLVSNADRVGIDDLGPGDYNHKDWINPVDDIDDAEVSRDGRRLASTFFFAEDRRLAFFYVEGDVKTETPPAEPDAVCSTDRDQSVSDPTWSPDGSSVAWSGRDGLNVMRFDAFGPGTCSAPGSTVISEAGGSPDWGPADPPAARYDTVSAGGANGGGANGGGANVGGGGSKGGGGGGTTEKPPAVTFSTAKATRAALRKGLTVKVTAPGAGTVKASLTVKGRKVAAGTAKAKRAGVVRLRLSKVTARRAARLKGKTLKLTVTIGASRAARSLKVR